MRVRVALAIAFVLGVLECVACTYDFTVGKKPSADGGATSDGDVELDGAAGGDASADDGGTGGGGDATAFDCQGFAVGLAQLRQNAVACSDTNPDACLTVVRDECGCNFGVGSNGTSTLAYRQGLAMYQDAGCKPACSACPTTTDFVCDHSGASSVCVPF